MVPLKFSTEFIAKLLGWIYIFAFIFMLDCYIYGLFGVINKESLEYDENRLAGIAMIRCAIEKYFIQKKRLPQSLYEEELRVGSTNSPAAEFAERSGITYRAIEALLDKQELICPETDAVCSELIANENFLLYELCADFKLDFGDEERALVRIPLQSGFPGSDYCAAIERPLYNLNPKHSKGRYCYIFYSSYSTKGKESYPSFIKKLNSYDDFYEKYYND